MFPEKWCFFWLIFSLEGSLTSWPLPILSRILALKRKNHPARWFFRRCARVDALLNRGNWLGGAQSPKLSFQCSLIAPETSRLSSSKHLTSGYRQSRFVVYLRRGLNNTVNWIGAGVGLNWEFLHTAKLGANHLQGTQLHG